MQANQYRDFGFLCYIDYMARKRFTNVPILTFHGAARCVTGSMHRLDYTSLSLLLDCGFVQGPRAESYRRNSTFPIRPKDIDAVLLSHAHIDHCGNLPNLLKQGFNGPIYCTPATRALTAVMLGDAAKIQAEDCEYLNAHRASGEPEIEPLYGEGGVYRTLLKLRAIPYDTPTEVLPGVVVTFVDAGHLLGSAMIHVRMGEHSLTYTGDLGRPGIPILRSPAPVPAADVVVCESTYGGKTHPPIDETAELLGDVVRRTASRGGKLIIPAFSVGRTQTVLYFLHQLLESRRIPRLPIFVDSPMSIRATEVFRAHPECFDRPALELMRRHPDLFGDSHVQYTEKQHESVALNRFAGPCIIISASGMCEAGRVVHHLRHNIEDERATILLAGFQAEGTLGRRIVERRPTVRILGRECRLRAEVISLPGLSSHADHPGIVSALLPLRESVKKVRLVHGEPERAETMASGLKEAGFADVDVPEPGDTMIV